MERDFINFDHIELEDEIQDDDAVEDDDATEDDNKNIFLPNIKIFFLNICFKNINILILATCTLVSHSHVFMCTCCYIKKKLRRSYQFWELGNRQIRHI